MSGSRTPLSSKELDQLLLKMLEEALGGQKLNPEDPAAKLIIGTAKEMIKEAHLVVL